MAPGGGRRIRSTVTSGVCRPLMPLLMRHCHSHRHSRLSVVSLFLEQVVRPLISGVGEKFPGLYDTTKIVRGSGWVHVRIFVRVFLQSIFVVGLLDSLYRCAMRETQDAIGIFFGRLVRSS